jgi:hypothetical protein
MELRIDNLQMDMTGVELLVANAHHQIQGVEDEVLPKFDDKWRRAINTLTEAQEDGERKYNEWYEHVQHSCVTVLDSFICLEKGIKENTAMIVWFDQNQAWLENWEKGMNNLVGEVRSLQDIIARQATAIPALKDCVGELELGRRILRAHMVHIEDRMDVDPLVMDLTGSEADGENSSEEPSSLSNSSSSSGLYDDGRQTFLSVPIIDVDEDPTENIDPLPIRGPSMVMLPGPSVLRSLISIKEEIDFLNDLRFIPPSLCGGEARPDIEVKEEEEAKGKVTGTLEFWAGEYE